jgi:hypothetical protein
MMCVRRLWQTHAGASPLPKNERKKLTRDRLYSPTTMVDGVDVYIIHSLAVAPVVYLLYSPTCSIKNCWRLLLLFSNLILSTHGKTWASLPLEHITCMHAPANAMQVPSRHAYHQHVQTLCIVSSGMIWYRSIILKKTYCFGLSRGSCIRFHAWTTTTV